MPRCALCLLHLGTPTDALRQAMASNDPKNRMYLSQLAPITALRYIFYLTHTFDQWIQLVSTYGSRGVKLVDMVAMQFIC